MRHCQYCSLRSLEGSSNLVLKGGAHSRLHAPITILTNVNTAELGFRTDDE
jgi:hypothetical protein